MEPLRRIILDLDDLDKSELKYCKVGADQIHFTYDLGENLNKEGIKRIIVVGSVYNNYSAALMINALSAINDLVDLEICCYLRKQELTSAIKDLFLKALDQRCDKVVHYKDISTKYVRKALWRVFNEYEPEKKNGVAYIPYLPTASKVIDKLVNEKFTGLLNHYVDHKNYETVWVQEKNELKVLPEEVFGKNPINTMVLLTEDLNKFLAQITLSYPILQEYKKFIDKHNLINLVIVASTARLKDFSANTESQTYNLNKTLEFLGVSKIYVPDFEQKHYLKLPREIFKNTEFEFYKTM